MAVSAFALACGDAEPSKPVCTDYVVPPGLELAAPVTTFRGDVLPVLVQSCAFSSCHGREGKSAAGLFLGVKDATFDAARVRAGLVGVASNALARMPLVVGSDAEGSFLMRKLDGDHCLLESECKEAGCGDAMPRSGALLPVPERDKIRRWIAQGAKDD